MTLTSLHSQDAAALRMAHDLWQEGRVTSARHLLDGILSRSPMHPGAVTLLARLLQSEGKLNAASQYMADLCRHLELEPTNVLHCAQFIHQCQRQALAATLCEEAIALNHTSPELHVMAGNLARELGKFEAAQAHYHSALEMGVDLDAWFVLGALAAIKRYSDPADPDIARLAAHFEHTAGSLHARAASGFGLAKAFDDLSNYESAAQILRSANLLSSQAQPWSRDGWMNWLGNRMHSRSRATSLPIAYDFVPVFIVGLPRSGTTLAATRLMAHSEVRDRGELPMLDYVAGQLLSNNLIGDASALRQAADLYRAHAVQDDPLVRWYIDKNPNNFRYLDLIEAMFPQARIIHCRRNPKDIALSIWSQSFAHPQYGFASSLDDIAAFIDGHDLLMDYWQKHLEIPVLRLDYESMIARPNETLEALRKFIGLPTSSKHLLSTQLEAISSASLWQARQPIYKTSVGRWKNYAPYIPELARF